MCPTEQGRGGEWLLYGNKTLRTDEVRVYVVRMESGNCVYTTSGGVVTIVSCV